MKKLCNVFVVLALLLVCGVLFSTKAEAASYNGFTYRVSNGEATITDYTGSATNLTIPSTLGGYPVTSIGNGAFQNCTSLTSVTIPDSVTRIDDYAFEGCKALTSVTIPDSVTSIDDYAFRDCTSLTSVTIGDSVTSIGDDAFYNCKSLTSVTIGDSVTSIGDSAFEGCKALTSVTIPDSVTSIGRFAFEYCTSLTTVTIPDSVTSIGDGAFQNCTSLTSVTIPDSVTSIGYYAFRDCKALTSVTIPDSVTSIGDKAFSGCKALTSVTIPDSVTSIGDDTFYDCTSLTSVTIPDSVISIGEQAFRNCYSLTSVTIGDSVTSIGDSAFRDCYSLTSVTIGDSVTSIGTWAFSGCNSLANVYVTDIYAWRRVSFSDSSADPMSYAENLHIMDKNGDEITEFIIDNTVTEIPANTFKQCTSLTSITIPDSVTSIGTRAFSGCDSLTSVTIPDSVASIGDYAFCNCDSLTSVTIPDSVTSIGSSAFAYCSALTSVTIGDSVTSIGDYAFYDCNALTSVTIGDSVTSIGDYAFEYCDDLTNVTIPDSVTSIGDDAFLFCSSLTGIWVDENNAYYCSDSKGVLFNKNKTTLIQAPHGISGSYTIPDSVTSIGDDAFRCCYSLTSVTIGDSVTSIGNSAFGFCYSLTSVTIGDSVTSIGGYAFDDCDGLTSVTIPDSVTSIGYDAFYSCDNLHTVYYAGNRTQWNAIDIGCENESLTSATIHYNHIHDYTLFPTVTVEPTCTEPGYIEYTCIYGETYREYIPALGHIAGADFVVTPPTCTAKGYTTFVCDRCGETFTTDYVAALGHDYSGTQTVVAPTCTEEGYTGTKCIHCDSVQKTDIVAATGHKMALVPAVAPTCTETGLTAGSGCQYCGLVGVAQKEVAATGHSYVDHEAKAPTCTEIGWEAYQTCENCDYSSYAELPVATHSLVDHAGQAATCTEPGWEPYQTCENCDYTTYTEIPATGIHNYIVFVQTISAGCTEQGYTVYKCEQCDSTENRDYTNVLGHNIVIDPAVDPTCTEPGWTMGTHCDRCGMVGFAQTEIPTIDHSYVDHEAKAPTCTEPGWEAYQTCENCDYNTCVEIFADHNFVDGACSGCGFAVKAEITTVVLRPSATGIYFKGAFDSDEVVSAQRRGIAVSVANASPMADDSDPTSLYTIGCNSVLIKNILDSSDGETFIYARAYVLLSDGTYVYGKTVAISLKMLLEEIDTKWNGVSTAQQKALFDMCSNYLAVTADWNIPNIHAAISAYCPHCDTYVDWVEWDGTVTGGHFYLAEDIVRTKTVNVNNAVDFVLDLRGNTITAENCRTFYVYGGATLSIVDTVGTGVITGGNSSGGRGGNIYAGGGNLNLYGGNIYGGTANADGNNEGHDVAVYNGSIVINGNVSIGGEYVGGHAVYVFNTTSATLEKANIVGGLFLRGVNLVLSNQLVVDRITMRNATFAEVESRNGLTPIAVQIINGFMDSLKGAFTAQLTNADTALAYFVPTNSDYEIINNGGKLELA